MVIRERPDGRMELDWKPPYGPYVTLSKTQWLALLMKVRELVK
jgi:hypothetical protein